MKKILFLQIVSVALVISTMSSCKKKGCTDSTSTNFCTKCNADDGSCQYQGNVVIWWNQATSTTWTNNLVSSIEVWVDGVLVGSSAANVYYQSVPTCGANGSITCTKNLGTSKTASATVVIKRATFGTVLNTGSFTYTGGACVQLQIQ